MLVLERSKDQRILIGEDVVLTVVEFRNKGGRKCVRIGIDAPKEIMILREELKDRKPAN